MVQLQALNYILKNKDLDLLSRYDEKYFFNYSKEYKFLKEYFDKTGKVIDILQMIEHFPDFAVIDTNESKQYIEDKLFEEYVYHFTKTFFETHDISDPKAKEDFIKELEQIKQP